MGKIDLHMHTTISDGKLTPKEIIDEAAKNGVTTMSITDHDSTEAYTSEIIEYAKNQGIQLIPGVEISTRTEKTKIHVLGYNYDLNNKEFKSQLTKIRESRHVYLKDVGKKLREIGYEINVEELDKIDAVTKSHIALDVINNKQNEDKLLKQFGNIPNKGMFIETIMNKGCPAYVKKETISPKEAADMIRNANGKVVLAHPMAYPYEGKATRDDIIEIIKEMKPDGIEALYIYVNKEENIIDEVDFWKKVADENNLFTTIGSDFHLYGKNHVEIGLINTNIKLDETAKNNIIEKLLK